VSERVRRHLAGEPDRDVETVRRGLIGRDAHRSLDRIAQRLQADVRVGSEREGWRARLANVERLLDESIQWYAQNFDGRGTFPLQQALVEVRSMIDGD
jgi:hypothetical protein